jgi:hypothetical protein
MKKKEEKKNCKMLDERRARRNFFLAQARKQRALRGDQVHFSGPQNGFAKKR